MIPKSQLSANSFIFKEKPSTTYKLNDNYSRVHGLAYGIEAVKQAIYLILNIERYEYIIYSWNYGIELTDLLGKPIPYITSELKRRISEALLVDSRITDVCEFEFEHNKKILLCRFKVKTIFGIIEAEKAVSV